MSIEKVISPIEMYHFCHPLYKAKTGKDDTLILELPITHNIATLHKQDIIAMAKAVNLNAHDIDCSEHKALCADLNQVDEDHFDELVEIQATVNNTNKSVN